MTMGPDVLDPASWCLAPVELDGDPPEPVTTKGVYASPLRVDLGCGPRKPEGFVGIDRHQWGDTDIVADLAEGIPLEDGIVDEVRAYDVLEHLPDPIHSMNELWRILKPGGKADILVPSTSGYGAWQDPTHRSFWNPNSFAYYRDGDVHRESLGEAYGIRARFNVIGLWEHHSPNNVIHVRALLEAVK